MQGQGAVVALDRGGGFRGYVKADDVIMYATNVAKILHSIFITGNRSKYQRGKNV